MQTHEWRVMANPYLSVRKNFIPVPALLALDKDHVLSLTRETDGAVLFSIPLKNLKSVQWPGMEVARKLSGNVVYIYVDINQAYEISFVNNTGEMDGALDAYKDALTGDFGEAKRKFLEVQSDLVNKSASQKQDLALNLIDTREEFIKIAIEEGVYTKHYRSLNAIFKALFAIGIFVLIVIVVFAFI